jgi:unsaturated chondroitin disaccharide hydrolase
MWFICQEIKINNYNEMKKYTLVCFTLALIILFASCDIKKKSVLSKVEIQFIKGQFENTLAVANDPFKIPRTITDNGVLKTVDIFDWTSGFFCR